MPFPAESAIISPRSIHMGSGRLAERIASGEPSRWCIVRSRERRDSCGAESANPPRSQAAGRAAFAAEAGDASGAGRGGRAHQRRRRSARRGSGPARTLERGAQSAVSPKSRPMSTCSIAASAGAIRRGCGSTLSLMSPWGATSASTVSCTTPAFGRRVLAESHEIPDIVRAVTDYVARRLVERQRALDEDPEFIMRVRARRRERERRRRRWRAVRRAGVRLRDRARDA